MSDSPNATSSRIAFLNCHPLLAPRVGLEPTTLRLTAECSTIELSRSEEKKCNKSTSDQNVSIIIKQGAYFK